MRLIILTTLLFVSINCFSETPSDCDFLFHKIAKQFKLNWDGKGKFPEMSLSNRNEYEKLKNLIKQMPDRKQVIDTYLAHLNDDNFVEADITGASVLYQCVFFENITLRPLFVFVEKNKIDKDLMKDYQNFLIERLKDIDNPTLINISIKATYLKNFTKLKQGEQSELFKNIDLLSREIINKQKEFSKATSKIMDSKKNLSKEEIKEVVNLTKEELALGKDFVAKYLDLAAKL